MKATINFKLDQDGTLDAVNETFKGIFHIEDIIDQDIKDERVVIGTIYKLTYTEGGIKNSLLINEMEQTVLSEGLNKLFFKVGEKSTVAYQTAAGTIDLGLETKELKIDRDEDKKELVVKIQYNLTQSDTVIENNMTFKIMHE